ncbi:MAG: hypothetical protein JNL14_14865 [Devosia sp.]|uniref:hypothetical protein n=1 Tax=Devosia sp. TaxID=1871048 RepID=UPI001A62E871|nr:hypothetical protein [Devosia sp.]MBL8599014.1 hypothetical protein [Devosia sp.]
MTLPAHADAAKESGHSIAFNLGAIALILAVAGLGLAYAVDAAGRAGHEELAGSVSRTLGGRELTVPAAWLREDAERSAGFAKQVDIGLHLPLGPKAATREVDITLVPRSRARPSASLLDGVYLHQFMPEQLSGPPGLIGKPLVAAEGYENETVWYDAISAAPFVAKCIAPVAEGEPGRCIRTVYLGPGIAAIYSFDEDVLVNWRQFDAAVLPSLKRIGAL